MQANRGELLLENLIFLPGASGNIEFWQPIISLLSPDYAKKIIAYPEFGGVPAQADIQNFDDLKQYVIHSINDLMLADDNRLDLKQYKSNTIVNKYYKYL